MAMIVDLLSWILLVSGGFFVLVGSLGLNRMPDFYTRNHATSIIDTLGAGLIIAGLILQSPDWMGAVKLALIMIFLFITSPTSTHALAKSALHGRLEPMLAPTEEDESSSS